MRCGALVLVLLMLSACSSPQLYWQNQNPSASWNTDLYQCTRESSTQITAGGGTGLVGALSAGEVGSFRTDYAMRDLCLQARGWYKVAAPQTASPGTKPTPMPPEVTPPATLPPMVLTTSVQTGWVFVARNGQGGALWIGVWGVDARSACEDRRANVKARNAQWASAFDECRSVSVAFQKRSTASSGPGWGVVDAKGVVGGPTEQECNQYRAKLITDYPGLSPEPCRQLWFSSSDWAALR